MLGTQHRIARGVLRVGQIADKTADFIGSIGGESHPVGSIVKKGLRGFSGLAPKLAVLAESGGELMSAGKQLKTAFEKRDIGGALSAGKTIHDIGKKAYETKRGDVSLKQKASAGGGMQSAVMPPSRAGGGFGNDGYGGF
jgi:hypothetical protein